MFELSTTAYVWVKALHVISVIAWMAGLLYLPRLFVYHTRVVKDSPTSKTFKIMERRLLQAIMHPAMVATLFFGGLLLHDFEGGMWNTGWLYAKLVFVAGLVVTHVFLACCVSAFANDNNIRSEKFYRIMNEVPTLLMIGIVILVIVQPF